MQNLVPIQGLPVKTGIHCINRKTAISNSYQVQIGFSKAVKGAEFGTDPGLAGKNRIRKLNTHFYLLTRKIRAMISLFDSSES